MDVNGIVVELRAIRLEIAELREDIDRYRGFIGGVAWCLSAIAGFIGFIWGLFN